jgi:hypothetical protein
MTTDRMAALEGLRKGTEPSDGEEWLWGMVRAPWCRR